MSQHRADQFSLVYHNAASLSDAQLGVWQALVQQPDHHPSLPSTPLLYAFVETGHREPHPGIPEWTCLHQPGPTPPNGRRSGGGGGISLFYHTDCAVQHLPAYSTTIVPSAPSYGLARLPSSSAVLCAIVRPALRAPFLLAAVYLPPQCARSAFFLTQLTARIEAASAAHPGLSLLVVGDFNCHHAAWRCPLVVQGGTTPTPCANQLARWINSVPLDIHNPLDEPTRVVTHRQADGTEYEVESVIDLVLSDPPSLVDSVVLELKSPLESDHRPLTITLALAHTPDVARPLNDRPRSQWNHRSNEEAWQSCLGPALSTALLPLQPALDSLSRPPPADTTAQALLDDVYGRFERAFLDVCGDVVGRKSAGRRSASAWLSFPGVLPALRDRNAALSENRRSPRDTAARSRFHSAKRAWRVIHRQAKQHSYQELCQSIMQPGSRLTWAMFKRATPSTFPSLASIANQANGSLPVSHAASLDNLCAAFVENGEPPDPADSVAHAALVRQVAEWANPAAPSALLSHPSDYWSFTADDVERQCTLQYTNTAPGPDTLLPVFLKHAGRSAWAALAAIYSFSWEHAVTPRAWREANVMALYKGEGSKSTAGSYRPISMTSIIIRTFEHLIHDRLVQDLASRDYLARGQFGFRKGYSTTDAIHYLVTAVQHTLHNRKAKGKGLHCPVLFLDIKKAFDRVDHDILLQRVMRAGIAGRAWRWLRSFLSDRQMRCVDAAEHSAWYSVGYGVPQGCVLSPLLFLIFINDLQRDILRDPNCSCIAPLFYADDGAIAPDYSKARGLPAKSFERLYLAQLKAAIAHLDRWCDQSRMLFGQDKTRLVVFTGRQQPDLTAYTALTLCGFTIQCVDSYLYLGVHLDHKLSWTRQHEHVLTKARLASKRVSNVALRAAEARFLVVRTLVLGYVIPSFSYGCLFWGRDTDLNETKRREIQAAVATPLRIALNLPRTTHQLGTLELCGVPTVSSLVMKAQLTHLARASGVGVGGRQPLPLNHPTRVLHRTSLRYSCGSEPKNALAPSKLLSTSTYLCSSVYPRVCYDPAIAPLLDTATLNALRPTELPVWQKSQEYWQKKNAERRKWAATNFSRAELRATLDWSSQHAANLTTDIIRQLSARQAHAEWTACHAPPGGFPPGIEPPPHTTTAPLTECKPSPGVAPFLHRHSTDTHAQQCSRARLSMGRSRTGETQQRFASTADAPLVNPNCTACSTPASPVLETTHHVLLHCPRHQQARDRLRWSTDSLGLTSPASPLTLSTILLASQPPPPFPFRSLPLLLRITTAFLTAVSASRALANLLPLDTG